MELDIVLYLDLGAGCWVAHCVQLDRVSRRTKPDEAWEDAVRQCEAQVKYAVANHLMADLFHSPPAELMEMMATGERRTLETRKSADGTMTFNQVYVE